MPLSWLYGKITDFRNSLYERGLFESFELGAPAISVGNLTVGGTGKTPLVRAIADYLLARGERVCILTRGYGRENPRHRVLVADGRKILSSAAEAGDEPFELALKLRGRAVIIADADRVAAARWALAEFDPSVFLLDDAFQHRRARRDLDIVVLDATDPFGNRKTLPFGILREPLPNIGRADLIVITRANLVGAKEISELKAQISKLNSGCEILTAQNQTSHLISLPDFHNNALQANAPATTDHRSPITDHRTALAFCALGNPQNFFEQLRRENFQLTAAETFPDHHRYTAQDVEKLSQKAEQTGAQILLTTAKDAVKLKNFDFAAPCLVVETAPVFDDEDKLHRIIDAVIRRHSPISEDNL